MSKTGKICVALVAVIYGMKIAHDAVLFGLGKFGGLELALNTGVTTVNVIAYIVVMCWIKRRDRDDKK